MCLTTKDPTIKVAERDIEVYKSLLFPKVSFLKRLFNPKSASPISTVWGAYTYHKGQVQPKVEIKSYERKDMFDTETIYVVHEGYHSHATPYILGYECNAKFIIPKGAKYIEGWNNDDKHMKNYVSETIVYVGKL